MSRQLALRLGRDGPTQKFSASTHERSAITTEVLGSIRADTDPAVRAQTLLDPTKCFQFACLWGTHVDTLTRPEIVQNHPNPAVVLGSYSDQIGCAVPVSVQVDDFRGFFTTLVTAGDADLFQFTRHHASPDLLRGPPAPPVVNLDSEEQGEPGLAEEPAPQPATLARLRFPMPENPTPADLPVIVALPCFLPIAPGHTFPPNVDITRPASYQDAFPLLRAWCRGAHYAYTHNNSHSVTLGGPMFHLPDLEDPEVGNPFQRLPVCLTLPASPTMLPPLLQMHKRVQSTIDSLSEETWIRLGSREVGPHEGSQAAPSPPSPSGVTTEQLQAILTPLVAARAAAEKSPKDVEQSDSAKDVAAAYRLALAALPSDSPALSSPASTRASDAPAASMTLPALHDGFLACLNKTKPVLAAQALQDLVRARVDQAQLSELALDLDITFDPNAITIAFANAVRSYFWITVALTRLTYEGAKTKLNLIHFLKPAQGFFLVQRLDEVTQTPVVLSHVSDDKAQLEASKSSTLYTNGCLSQGHDVYSGICNLLMLLSVMVPPDGPVPLLVQKLKTYASVLRSPDGRIWCDTYRHDLRVAVHLFQDCQHMITNFFSLGVKPSLKKAVLSGQPVDALNYWNAARQADSFIDRLRGLITGNSLGDFIHTPHTLAWFHPSAAKALSTPARTPSKNVRDVTPQNFRTPPTTKGTPTQATAPKKLRLTDQADVDRRKQLGILTFDKKVGGNRLPHCPVYAKATKDASSQERLCMQFATQGHYCSRTNCPFPHIAALAKLPKEAREEMVKWVAKTPGLDFAQGKGPAGTP